ncbi:MAG TPA: AAA family ATPase [Bryobacteraceae bacterium]|nr:AAA family ATPase [Bryobacteraceae bacterium]
MMRPGDRLDASLLGRPAQELQTYLSATLVGQEEAITDIVNAYQLHATRMTAQGRPVANLLFLGPTGSGKTRAVEATAEGLLGSPRAILKVDCGEFQHSHEIAKLIGSPPGYLGHRETHPMLSQEALSQYHTQRVRLSFLLFDEIEKASDALWNLLLGILDKATLTLGDGSRVDFTQTMIFLTSNLGVDSMTRILSPKLGFVRETAPDAGGALNGKLTTAGLEAARRKFTPEFVNRLDKIVVFRALGDSELRRVLDIELRIVQERVFRRAEIGPFVFSVSEAAKDVILAQGTDARYGARHLKRAIDRLLMQPMANLIASGQIRAGDWIRADSDASSDVLAFYRDAESMTAYTMSEVARDGGAGAASAAAA